MKITIKLKSQSKRLQIIAILLICSLNVFSQSQKARNNSSGLKTPMSKRDTDKKNNYQKEVITNLEEINKSNDNSNKIIDRVITFNNETITAIGVVIALGTLFISYISFIGYKKYSKIEAIQKAFERKIIDESLKLTEAINHSNREIKNLDEKINNADERYKKYIQDEAAKMVRMGMVDHYVKIGYFSKALEEIVDFEKLNPNENDLIKRCKLNKAAILCNKDNNRKDYDMSIELLKDLVGWPEFDIEIWNLLAYCYMEKFYNSEGKEFELVNQALSVLNKIPDLKDPAKMYDLKVNLGNCEFWLNHFDLALKYFLDAESNYSNGIDEVNQTGSFYLCKVEKLCCYFDSNDKGSIKGDFEKFNKNAFYEGLQYCKREYSLLAKWIEKLEEEYRNFSRNAA